MKLKHYVQFYKYINGKKYFKVEEIESRDVSKLSIDDDVFTLVIFDRMIDETNYKGKVYPVESEKLNQELYYVGYFYSLEDIKEIYGKFIYDVFVSNEYIGEIVCQVGFSTCVKKDQVERKLGHLITPPHIKFKDLEELKARREEVKNAKGSSDIAEI